MLSSKFMESVEDGEIEITAHHFPSFLYENGTVYNPDDEVTGLFRGFLLVRVRISCLLCLMVSFLLFRFFGTFSLGQRQR